MGSIGRVSTTSWIGWNDFVATTAGSVMETTSWTGWNDFIATIVGFIMESIRSIDTIGSTWILSITWSKLGSVSSSTLPYIVVALSSSPPPPPMSSEQVHSSSSFESLMVTQKYS